MASSETAAAAAADYPDSYRDWSGLPEDLLLIAMAAMEVPELVRSGAVCRLWRSAFVTFRGLLLRSTRQPVPCLLYGRRSDAAVFLYSPSTHTNYRVPLSAEAASGIVGSAYGWLFTTDFAANPYLINPLTGARVALPPITTLERVMGRKPVFSVDGNDDHRRRGVVYDVDFGGPYRRMVGSVTAREAREWMYRRVAMSASPSVGAGCIVLLLHMPYQELSFARLGDERWTSLSGILRYHDCHFQDIVHNPINGLFYLLADGWRLLRSLDLAGPSPVATNLVQLSITPYYQLHGRLEIVRYLVVTPCGDLLLVERLWRRRPTMPVGAEWLWHNRATTNVGEDILTVAIPEEERICDVSTVLMRLSRLRYPQFVLQEKLPNGVGADHALFLGYGGATVCLTVDDYHPMIRGNCAYLTDDSDQTYSLPCRWLDHGIWDFGSSSSDRSLQKLIDVWRLHHPLANSPVPIWITPSLD
ncbi:hypothetical protein ABZP36_008573 [Zizania latifolia]